MAFQEATEDDGETYWRSRYDGHMELLRYVMHGKHDVVVRHHQSVRRGGWLLWGVWNLTSSILIRTPLWILRMSTVLQAAESSCLEHHHDNRKQPCT
jgi:hypothetical protein